MFYGPTSPTQYAGSSRHTLVEWFPGSFQPPDAGNSYASLWTADKHGISVPTAFACRIHSVMHGIVCAAVVWNAGANFSNSWVEDPDILHYVYDTEVTYEPNGSKSERHKGFNAQGRGPPVITVDVLKDYGLAEWYYEYDVEHCDIIRFSSVPLDTELCKQKTSYPTNRHGQVVPVSTPSEIHVWTPESWGGDGPHEPGWRPKDWGGALPQ
jgi:hypothetical protein